MQFNNDMKMLGANACQMENLLKLVIDENQTMVQMFLDMEEFSKMTE